MSVGVKRAQPSRISTWGSECGVEEGKDLLYAEN
jgi:hypothetical protein